ncbi:hypothetical protein ACH4ZU_20395 [Streptomyces sp. NPDC020472]|uniref:hypothetical protein n=1 Tax=Streptomyces sp. NPDC020472 TaxID=3365075 RepID=UPI0037B3373E
MTDTSSLPKPEDTYTDEPSGATVSDSAPASTGTVSRTVAARVSMTDTASAPLPVLTYARAPSGLTATS